MIFIYGSLSIKISVPGLHLGVQFCSQPASPLRGELKYLKFLAVRKMVGEISKYVPEIAITKVSKKTGQMSRLEEEID